MTRSHLISTQSHQQPPNLADNRKGFSPLSLMPRIKLDKHFQNIQNINRKWAMEIFWDNATVSHISGAGKSYYLAVFSFKHWLVNVACKQRVGEVVEVSDCLKSFLRETPSYSPVSVYAAEQEKSSIFWDVPLLPRAPHSNEIRFSSHSWGCKDEHVLE